MIFFAPCPNGWKVFGMTITKCARLGRVRNMRMAPFHLKVFIVYARLDQIIQ